MKFIGDLHIHSHFSRATARNLDPEHLTLWGKKKGITLIGSGDFTHAGWINELQEKTIEADLRLHIGGTDKVCMDIARRDDPPVEEVLLFL